VLFPSLNTKQFDGAQDSREGRLGDQVRFLSINRYERKKNLGLAIKAFGELRKSFVGLMNKYSDHLIISAQLRSSLKSKDLPQLKLVMAGGYDSRVVENVEHFAELETLAQELGLDGDEVAFRKSPSDAEKLTLLRTSHALLYTPSGEHFGIVPIEAMYCEVPVIAVNNGGPTETVVDGGTGYLCNATPDAFATAMAKIVNGGSDLRRKLGQAGRRRVQQMFAFEAFAQQLHNVIMNLK
jgi:alpha-1,3/alpha-1,6-mannosyltransferase